MAWSNVIKSSVFAAIREVGTTFRDTSPDSMATLGMMQALLLRPTPQPERHEAAAVPQARPATKKKPSQRTMERGEICVQIKDEMKWIRYMTREGGKNINEIRAERPDFRFWQFVESRAFSEEDRETALHPNQWGTGYPGLLLSKYFGVSVLRIRDYVTQYNRAVRNKTPRAH